MSFNNKETNSSHVLITEYLTDTSHETKAEEYNTIAVSPNDHRWYRLIELRNGLRCMLVTSTSPETNDDNLHDDDDDRDEFTSDHHTTSEDRLTSSDADDTFSQYQSTTIALCIPAGSLSDPTHSQGFAHLIEHLLFSGSKKYPEANCLDTFLSYYGGTIHAYTELELTMIIIEVSSNRVVETLDILLHSLIHPLMSLESLYDQIQVIDDECNIAQYDDYYRVSRLLAHLARRDHPINQFSWGNKHSLKELVQHTQNSSILQQCVSDLYCIPEAMNLVMISQDSFHVMQQRIERLFCLLRKSYKTLPDYIGLPDPWNSEGFQKFHLVYPSDDIHQLRLSFPLPAIDKYWKIKPADYIRFIFNHEAPGSLNSYLKNKLWISNIDFDTGDSQLYRNSSSSLLTMNLHLTRQGLKNIHPILDSVFEAIYLLKRFGALKRVYDDMQLADLHGFLFQEKNDSMTYADTIARNLRKYPPLFVLFGHQVHLQFEPVSILNTIHALDPRTCNIMLTSKLTLAYCDQTEPWFKIKYGQYEIPNHWISYWLHPNINPGLTIPDSSQYLTVDFSIKPFDVPANDMPVCLIRESFGTLWYLRNQQSLPKAFFYLYFLSPYVNLTPQHSCLFDFYTSVLNSLLRAHAYPGKASHISMQFTSVDTGLILKLTGFNQHLSKYLETLLKVMHDFPIHEDGLAAWKQELKDDYHRELSNTRSLIRHVRLYLMKGVWWPVFEKLQFLDDITFKQISDFSILFRSQLTLTMLIAGNMTGEESKEIFYATQDLLRLGPVDHILLPTLRAVQLPCQETLVKIENYVTSDCSTHLQLFFEHGVCSIRDYVLVEILAETIQESLEDYLQSTGSNDFSCNVTLRDTYGIVSLQIDLVFSSEIYHSLDVVDHVNKFFRSFKDLLIDTTQNDFERFISMFRNGCLTVFFFVSNNKTTTIDLICLAKQNIDHSLPALVERAWTEILLNAFLFDRNLREREVLDTLSVNEMQEWYNEHILSENRRQLILIVCSTDEIGRSKTGFLSNNLSSHGIHDHRSRRSSVRSNVGISSERFQRSSRRQDLSVSVDLEDRLSLLQTKSDSKLRCLTTKRKQNIEIRTSKSETLPVEKFLNELDSETKLDYIIKSFESIEIEDEYGVFERNRHLKLLIDQDANDPSKKSFVIIRNLKEFKDSCLLYNVATIK